METASSPKTRTRLALREIVSVPLLCAAALTALLVGPCAPALATSARTGAQEKVVPYIVGGSETSIAQVPWQVFIRRYEPGAEEEGLCGGSILNATTILTAAHCIDHEGSTTPYPAADFTIVSGTSNIRPYLEEESPAATGAEQVRVAASVRQHPDYNAETHSDDVAVITVSKPLTLSAAEDAEAIALAPESLALAPGTPLLVSGFGKQEGAGEPNGKLYSTNLEAVSADACRETLGPDNSAIVVCATGATSATCEGDSGGALVTTNPVTEVGIVDYGPVGCPAGQADAFTSVTAPEIRAFIEGSETPPLAPRLTAAPVLETGLVPVSYSPMTCEPGGWSDGPTSFTYTFQAGEAPNGPVLQSGSSNVYVPPSTTVGDGVTCIVNAANAGGTATARTGTSLAIVADSEPPTAAITGVSCSKRSCALQIAASDPNGVALALEASASYRKSASCPKTKKHAHRGKGKAKALVAGKKGKSAACHKSVTLKLAVAGGATPGTYQAVAGGLPYGVKVFFQVSASNAAGLHQTSAATASKTLSKPKAKKRGHGKKRHGKAHKR